MRAALLILVAACAARSPALAPSDPARGEAPAGRLAPAPASLRPGVVSYPDLPRRDAAPPPPHHHHGS